MRPRAPSSAVFETTLSSGGSDRNSFGSLQGAIGSAHVSSIGVGARMPSLYDAYAVKRAVGLKLSPTDGLNRVNVAAPFSCGSSPVRSSISTCARFQRPATESVQRSLNDMVSLAKMPV